MQRRKRNRRRPGDGLLLYFCNFHTYSAGETVDLSGKNSFTPSEMSSAMEVVWWRREGSEREGG